MSSALFTGRSDRTLQCALPALLEDTAAFKQSFDLYRQLQAALKLICNSHPFYKVNRRHSSGWMNCLETTAGNSQLCWLHCQVWGELSSMVWGFFWGAWLHINGQGEGLVANTESWEPREAQQLGREVMLQVDLKQRDRACWFTGLAGITSLETACKARGCCCRSYIPRYNV